MFEIDLDDQDAGTWFRYQESHFDEKKGEFVFDPPVSDARVRVRQIAKFLSDQLAKRKKAAEMVLNPKTRRMERVAYYEDLTPEQEQKEMEDAYDYAIVGLENFKNKKTGKVIECTRENKLALIKNSSFDRFLGRCFKVLSGFEEERKEGEEKN
jgi:hypothetical protein